MTKKEIQRDCGFYRLVRQGSAVSAVLFALLWSSSALAQNEVRYSWFEISYVAQDVDRSGSQFDVINQQTVDVAAKDGDGIRFRGSIGTWNNLYAFVDFSSSDPDVDVVVTTPITQELAVDEFDYTAIRGGVGLRFPVAFSTDVYGELSYDSLDLDFGVFAAFDNFDANAQDIGVAVGVRSMFTDRVELRAYARYTSVGDVDLNFIDGDFDSDTLFGVGFGYEIVRGLSVTGDFEAGEFTSWNIGFRLDLDED